MRAIVTGGDGFIGYHVACRLQSLGVDVLVLDKKTGNDICDERNVNAVFESFKPDIVYHFAAYASEGLSHIIKRHIYLNNVVGSMNIINACVNNKVKFLVNASSIAALDPLDTYGLAKRVVEDELEQTHKYFGLEYANLRFHNVYGPGQTIRDPYRNVVGRFIWQVMSDTPITVYGDGSQTRNFTYIDDLVGHILHADAYAKNKTVLIGSETPNSILALANLVTRLMNVPDHEIRMLPARDEVHLCLVKHEYQLGETTPIEEGVRRMISWATGGVTHHEPTSPSPEITGHGTWRPKC